MCAVQTLLDIDLSLWCSCYWCSPGVYHNEIWSCNSSFFRTK